jgi:hypothetical protein
MNRVHGYLLLLLLGLADALGATNPKLLLIEQRLNGFTDHDYATAVERLLTEHEQRTAIPLRPGSLQRCGLKVSSDSGMGLCTPKPLIRALGAALLRRGFTRDGIIICDARQEALRQCGLLPILSKDAARFEGFPVMAWDQLAPGWADDRRLQYENQVMPSPGTAGITWGNPRISILPKTLFDDVDFWINLPVLSDSHALGVHGAIAAASFGNMVNAERFMNAPANAGKAAVEVCATPGLTKRQALTILSLETYQVLGGPTYDANWILSDKIMIASANPVIIDYIGLQKINAGRSSRQVGVISPEPPIFGIANDGEIHLGTCKPSEITLVRLAAP